MVLLQVLLLGLLAAVQASPAPQHFGIKSGIGRIYSAQFININLDQSFSV